MRFGGREVLRRWLGPSFALLVSVHSEALKPVHDIRLAVLALQAPGCPESDSVTGAAALPPLILKGLQTNKQICSAYSYIFPVYEVSF